MTVYSYTGSAQTHTVGVGAVAVLIECKGAQGGGANGGLGSIVSGLFLAQAGDTFGVYVGGQGGNTGAAGWNGGGSATITTNGGGGGGSDVRRGGSALANRIIVGGAGGGHCNGYVLGGKAGYPNGAKGPGGDGQGGSQTAGGIAANAYATNGSLGQGGNGLDTRSAGGGGGYYGGSGGAGQFGFSGYLSGGPGGSSYIGPIGSVAQGVAPFGPLIEGALPVSGVVGTNTGDGQVTITDIVAAPFGAVATGGTETDVGRYHLHTFTASGDFTLSAGGLVEAWLIAGGGGSGSSNNSYLQAGGAGAGGVLELKGLVLTAGTYPVVVGAGGAACSYPGDGGPGGDSTFAGYTAKGGGEGVRYSAGKPGGSSGGGGDANVPGQEIPRQGNKGGAGGGSNTRGGGGGGAGGPGNVGGIGFPGAGLALDITGTSVTYAAGGSGSNVGPSAHAANPGSGALSVIGTGYVAGQAGIVLIRYLKPYSIVKADLASDGVMVAGVQQRNPVSIVQVGLESEGLMSTMVMSRQFKQPPQERNLVWVYGINGMRRNVID